MSSYDEDVDEMYDSFCSEYNKDDSNYVGVGINTENDGVVDLRFNCEV